MGGSVWHITFLDTPTIADIWTKFYIELKHYTINTTECSKFIWLENPRWRRPPSWILENFNNFGLDEDILHQIIWEDAPRPCGYNHVTKIWNRKLIRVTSSNEGFSICASISVTITDIWTKCGTEHKYCTINTLAWSNSHKLKIQDGGGRHLWFWKMSITPNWIELFAQKLVGRCITAMRRWHMAKSRNWNFFAWRHYYDE